MQSALNLALVIFILLMVNYLGFKWYDHRDLSTSQFYTLSPKTEEVLKKLDAPVRITTILINKERAQYWEQTQNLLEEYQRVGGKNVTVEKVDPVYDRARAVALQNRLHFAGTDNLVIFEYKDRSRFVKQDDLLDINPMTQQVGGYKGEQQFTSAILSLVEGKPSKVYFTAGHGEHAIDDLHTATGYGAVGSLLKGENIEVASLNLAARGGVPPDADAVVVAGALDRLLAARSPGARPVCRRQRQAFRPARSLCPARPGGRAPEVRPRLRRRYGSLPADDQHGHADHPPARAHLSDRLSDSTRSPRSFPQPAIICKSPTRARSACRPTNRRPPSPRCSRCSRPMPRPGAG